MARKAPLPPLGIEPRNPNRPACYVATIPRYPLRRSASQADFTSRKTGFASTAACVEFAAGKKVRVRHAILRVILSLVSCHTTKASPPLIYHREERKLACHMAHFFRENKIKIVAKKKNV